MCRGGIANSGTLSFATIDFDPTLPDPTMRVRIVQKDGTVGDEKEWKLSELGGGQGAEKRKERDGSRVLRQ